MELPTIEAIMRSHARNSDVATMDTWLTAETLCRYRDWVPAPKPGERRLAEIGCYQPSVGYYFHLGWKEVVGLFMEEGECNSEDRYATEQGKARMIMVDVEKEQIPLESDWADVLLMMEVFEHFGIDPMHALWEANRILKPGGRLVLSTPNAASIDSFCRIMRGMAPHGSQEFNGFSTNRHNRIYVADELLIILREAGFRVDRITSRSYGDHQNPISEMPLRLMLSAIDAARKIVKHWKPERGAFLFVEAEKESAPRERYPASLYFNPGEYPVWLETLRKRGKFENRG
jgi:SAM-dependent methyltransferase